jgi:cytochrome c
MQGCAVWLIGAIAVAATPGRAQMTFPVQPAKPDPATLFINQCGTCHSVRQGDGPRQGPNLFGVVGRRAGSLPGFKYSAGFAGADFVWDAPHLEVWLTNPQAMIKGTVMTYRQADPSVRQTIIDWLKEKH